MPKLTWKSSGALLLSLLVLSAMILVFPAAAQEETPTPAPAEQSTGAVSLRAEPAFDGNFKYGEWLPIWVELENDGPDIHAEVRVTVSTNAGALVYAAPVSLPNGARKRLPLFVLPKNFSRELVVEVINTGIDGTAGDSGPIEASVKVKVKLHPNITFLVGLVAPQQSTLSLIQGIEIPGQRRPIELVEVGLEELPEKAEGLRSFDVLVLNDVDTSTLTPEQVTALEGWVRNGGRLVVGGGAGAQATAAGLSDALLVLRPTGDRQVDELPALEVFSLGENPIRVPGPLLVATGDTGQLAPANLLAGEPDMPLVVETRLGNGLINWGALDITQSPFDAWSGATLFWQALLSPGAAYPDYRPADISASRRVASHCIWRISSGQVLLM